MEVKKLRIFSMNNWSFWVDGFLCTFIQGLWQDVQDSLAAPIYLTVSKYESSRL